MNYLITVIADNITLEKVIFSYRDEALHFADIRRKQGYLVTITTIEA